MDGSGEHIGVQSLLIEDHVGADDAAADRAAGHAGGVPQEVHGVLCLALHAVVAQGGAVELVDGLAPAAWWRPSMFWVTTAVSLPACSSSDSFKWAGLGLAPG